MIAYEKVTDPRQAKWSMNWKRKNKARVAAYYRAYRRRHPEKTRAHSALKRAIAKGLVVRPETCDRCGAGRCKIDGHHHRGYDRPLDVEWLCPGCHAEERTLEAVNEIQAR